MDDIQENQDHRAKSQEFSAVVVLGCAFLGTTLLLLVGIFKLAMKVFS